MAKEPDQTKWVGIRPTDPSENIPVTESNPVEVVAVFPLPDSDYFKAYTRKDSPAISDLQAIKAPLHHYVITTKDCSVSYNRPGVTVPAGEIYVITSMAALNETSMCDIEFYIRGLGATARRLAGYYSIEPNTVVSWEGLVVLTEDHYNMGGFKLGGVADDIRVMTHGYIIGVY